MPFYERFDIQSPLSPEAALDKLAIAVEPVKSYRSYQDKTHQFFEGAREGSTFWIRRIPGYGNGFLPEITLKVMPSAGGALARVSMHPAIAGMIFMGVWCTVMLAFSSVAVLAGAPEGGLMPLGLVVFVVVLGLFLFDYEVKKAKPKLLEVFNGVLAEPASKRATNWPNG